ncbi:MAG: sigma-70 family RNA polymerase sigma factor [Coleofasciculus sp. S288]|nr:sigma-70 family RNA polymerase sigma factor [Coleofasciculus sp. S288]
MRPRQEITELFSTFAQFEADRFSKWVTDAQLRRSMRNCQECSSEISTSEYFWALYWYKQWQEQFTPAQPTNLAGRHLSAYLQELCYWAAQRTEERFRSPRYGVAEYFQMAIAQVNKVLSGFDPKRSSSLKTYAKIAFPSLLKDILRQRREVDICKNWVLLRKVSNRRLVEALQNAGFSATEIARYRLACTCFRALYIQEQPGGVDRLPEPDRELSEAIARLYNKERQTQLTPPGPECSPEMIEQWLARTAALVRTYLYPPVDSLQAPSLDDDTRQDTDLPDPNSGSLLATLIAEEEATARQALRTQMHQVLVAAMEKLDPESQEILRLYYRHGWTQKQIKEEMGISQSTVTRRLSRGREALLAALVQWGQEAVTSQEDVNSFKGSNQVEDMSLALKEWLRVHYSDPEFCSS